MKPTLVLLHGVNGTAAELAPLAKALNKLDVRALDLLGHGGRDVPDGYTLEEMAEDVIRWLDAEGVGRAWFLGYSLGGYLALYIARHWPERVQGVIGIIVKHVFDPDAVAHITYLCQPARLSRPGNPRAGELARAHGVDNWVGVTNNTARLFQSFGERPPLADADFRAIRAPVLLIGSTMDPLVPEAHSRALAALLPNARLGIFPGTAHPLGNLPLATVMRAAKDFIAEVEQGTFRPGGTLNLTPRLVSEGTPAGQMPMTIRRGSGS